MLNPSQSQTYLERIDEDGPHKVPTKYIDVKRQVMWDRQQVVPSGKFIRDNINVGDITGA